MGGQFEYSYEIQKLLDEVTNIENIILYNKPNKLLSDAGVFTGFENKFREYSKRMFNHVTHVERSLGKEEVMDMLNSWFVNIKNRFNQEDLRIKLGGSQTPLKVQNFYNYFVVAFIHPLEESISEYSTMFDVKPGSVLHSGIVPKNGLVSVWKLMNDKLNAEYMKGRLFEASEKIIWEHNEGLNSAVKFLQLLTT